MFSNLFCQLVLESAYENGQSRLVGVMKKLVFGICLRSSIESSSDEGEEYVNSAEIRIEMSTKSQNPLYTEKVDFTSNPAFDSATASSEDEWRKHFDASSSRNYWYNERTQESKWDE